MSDTRVERLAATIRTDPAIGDTPAVIAERWIKNVEAAGLVVIDPDDIDLAAMSRLARNAYIHAAPVPLNNKWMAVMAAVLEALKVTR